MTIRLYKRDPYLFEFEGLVEEIDGEWVRLDGTAFYPGGGGQASDHGSIQGIEVTACEERGEELWHLVPGHNLKEGDIVWCSVDWERRYDLMRGHTAEHMLFAALQRVCPEINLIKIDIGKDRKRLTVDRRVDWHTILTAQTAVNLAIEKNLTVSRYEIPRQDAEEEGIRVKLDRIDDNYVEVVEIGDFDRAACSGIHVMETGELEAVFVERISSAGGGAWNIDFKIGRDAIYSALRLANMALEAEDILSCPQENLIKTIENLKNTMEKMRRAVSSLSQIALSSLKPRNIGGLEVYAEIYYSLPRKEMQEAAEKIRNKDGVAILISVDERIDLVLSSSERSEVDCLKMMEKCVRPLGGSGGGKRNFAQGSIPDPSLADDLLNCLLRALES
ncbi:MAG: alanyl-tRNA synthetase [Candidatus Methanomethylophilaceae archaeon]|nr:alanyl-tRNA synthetase [Candidatus Methanomethylophilaceae archaeon]HIJ00197.1 alanyl-tRNA editing protein [Candidatus Methanomethylophilaceae archaeon]